MVSAYEAGRRQPAVPMLARLVAAAGCDLRLVVEARPAGLERLTGPVGRRVVHHRMDIIRCASAVGVAHLSVFGSVARGQEGPESDLDLLVDVTPGVGLLGLGRLQEELEEIVGAPVDLVPSGHLKPDVRERVAQDLIAL